MKVRQKQPNEAEVHFALFADLQSEMKSNLDMFDSISPEFSIAGGRADLVLFKNQRAVCVIE